MGAGITHRVLLGLALTGVFASLAGAQQGDTPTTSPADADGVAQDAAPISPPPAVANMVTPPPSVPEPVVAAADNSQAEPDPKEADALPTPSPPPPPPVRSPSAVVQVLDKVTAETIRFAVPIGRPVRYKTLVFTAKACETRGLNDPLPQPSVYLIVESDSGAGRSSGAQPKQIFRGWMFANSPGVHAMEHPTDDAWLIACSTAAPSA